MFRIQFSTIALLAAALMLPALAPSADAGQMRFQVQTVKPAATGDVHLVRSKGRRGGGSYSGAPRLRIGGKRSNGYGYAGNGRGYGHGNRGYANRNYNRNRGGNYANRNYRRYRGYGDGYAGYNGYAPGYDGYALGYDRRRDSSVRYSRNHRRNYRYYDTFGQLVITLGEPGDTETVDSGNVILEEGTCPSGDYCTLRLGPYASSPKIITLNDSGKAITTPGM